TGSRKVLFQRLQETGLSLCDPTSDRIGVNSAYQAGCGRGIVVDRLSKADAVRKCYPIDFATRVDWSAVFRRSESTAAVKILHRQTERIHDLVTARADRIGSVRGYPFARCPVFRIGRVLNNGKIYVARRIGNLLTKDKLAQRLSPQRRRTAARV